MTQHPSQFEVGILTRITFGTAVATCLGAGLLTAQATADLKGSRVWGLQGLRTGYCVRFLIDPRAASRKLKESFRLIRADQDSSLHPALRQTIQTQPEFATWTPSSLCFYFIEAVQVEGQRVSEKDPRKTQMIGAWTLATRDQNAGRRDMALDLYSARGKLIRVAEASGVRMHEAQTSVADRPDTTTDIYTIKLEKAVLIWRGHPAGDSTRVARPIRESWSVAGVRTSVWVAQVTLTPTWSRPLVGSLTVEGKGDLAKMLRASPIRFVGPVYHGGGGELRFSR